MSPMTWNCVAYGDSPLTGTCFFQEVARCETYGQCQGRIERERVRIFDRINELADAGDPDFRFMADTIKSPDELLGGKPADELPELADLVEQRPCTDTACIFFGEPHEGEHMHAHQVEDLD
ncbi:MAG TPA: hypothetical protein VE287_05015 [Actinopolymorphaceae bacterium]|nr:hypothetical protein [Actinopolymorphaceae bacterium]